MICAPAGIASNPAECSVSPQSLTFTPQDWNVSRTITVTGIADRLTYDNAVDPMSEAVSPVPRCPTTMWLAPVR